MNNLYAQYVQWRSTPHGRETYDSCVSVIDRLLRRGHKHYSIRAIVHIVRFHRHLETAPEDDYKINDHVTPYLARELMVNGDAPAEFFETREVAA